ncbi:MAG: hypothetical protein AVDCRST_MAG37-655, partial [uncultured Rubrobacteraceae bacterium]
GRTFRAARLLQDLRPRHARDNVRGSRNPLPSKTRRAV